MVILRSGNKINADSDPEKTTTMSNNDTAQGGPPTIPGSDHSSGVNPGATGDILQPQVMQNPSLVHENTMSNLSEEGKVIFLAIATLLDTKLNPISQMPSQVSQWRLVARPPHAHPGNTHGRRVPAHYHRAPCRGTRLPATSVPLWGDGRWARTPPSIMSLQRRQVATPCSN